MEINQEDRAAMENNNDNVIEKLDIAILLNLDNASVYYGSNDPAVRTSLIHEYGEN